MKNVLWRLRRNASFLLRLALFVLVFAVLMMGELYLIKPRHLRAKANGPTLSTPMPNSSPTSNQPPYHPSEAVTLLLRQAFQLMEQKKSDAALEMVNAALQLEPRNPAAYGLRGAIYSEQKNWDQAGKDFHTALEINPGISQARLNLAEIEFLQKKYQAARPDFAALQDNPNLRDLGAYKVFLCDLFGGNDAFAAKELAAFNQVGSNASYYFANSAWYLDHHQPENARGWLTSAANIYPPAKFRLYAASLINLGYLPLPPPQN